MVDYHRNKISMAIRMFSRAGVAMVMSGVSTAAENQNDDYQLSHVSFPSGALIFLYFQKVTGHWKPMDCHLLVFNYGADSTDRLARRRSNRRITFGWQISFADSVQLVIIYGFWCFVPLYSRNLLPLGTSFVQLNKTVISIYNNPYLLSRNYLFFKLKNRFKWFF